MINNQQLYSFLCNKFDHNPFRIYYSQNINLQSYLIYSHREMEIDDFPINLAPNGEKFTIQSDEEKMLITFFYSENNQVLLYLSNPNIALSEDELESMYVIFSFIGMENKMKAKEAELSSMIESIRSITSSLELDDVLNKIITQALSVIPAADVGFLQLYDEKTKELTSRAAVGFNEKLQAIKIKSGESITGKVFRDGKPVIYYSRAEIYEGMGDISEENFEKIQGSFDNTRLKSLISVPLLMENNTIGVMTVHQYDAAGKLSIDDLRLLEGFAAQAAITIHNAKLYKKANERLEEITELTKQLREKNKLLSRRAEIHETLTRLSLQNKSVEFIIREVNHMMNRDIYFYDNLDTWLFPRKAVSYPYLSNDEYSRILSTKKMPFYIDIIDQNQMHYYVYPILSDRVSLGCFILPLNKPISSQDKMTIEQASSVLALEMTKRKTQAEVYYKKTQELFNDLLQYKDPRLLEEIGESLGLSSNSFFSVLLLEVVSYTELQTLEAIIHRLISRIKRRIPEKGTLIFGFHNKVTILFSTNNPNEIDEVILGLHSLLLKWGNQEELPLHAGLSTPYQGIQSISKCYDEANKSLSYLISRQKTGIMNYKKIGINRLFLSQPSPEIEGFADDILSPLRSEKAQNNDLEKTLFTYVKLNKSIVETAEKLHIHKNTLYHRIKKIEELLQLEFHNPDDFLQILLACHLHESFPHREK
ncbi:helix-turn-helix domain-containing protein [Bacillus sp. FJAT-29790]|uniref:helix-turn-helix domain-containing protein n=1 Tax=Bacillus sp. FJAT-29790 TaxID=1895002 RepID=UPI001C250001|nr:helix-turn-helix domain-containing protein [Bacillus sp. FJAT-29790]MBU8880574.1 helix-turn-helix domain-containing protein [Bacillus sp. FJAT-29790]